MKSGDHEFPRYVRAAMLLWGWRHDPRLGVWWRGIQRDPDNPKRRVPRRTVTDDEMPVYVCTVLALAPACGRKLVIAAIVRRVEEGVA